MNEGEADRIFQKAFRAWLERQLNDDSPGLRRAFARIAHGANWGNTSAIDSLQYAARMLIDSRDYTALWKRESFPREEQLDSLATVALGFAALCADPRNVNDPLHRHVRAAIAFSEAVQ